jgi:glycosyltransferase involved in cell wall biosynthesis
MMAAIPIGVTARNEARNILALLDSLRAAIRRASAELGVRYEIHVLLNDNSDETPRLLAGHADVTLWNTRGGIVEAQRALAEGRGPGSPFLIFCDADIIVHAGALLEISRTMLECPEVEVAYAEKYPVPPLRRTPLARALYLYNLREGYQTRRHYFNGQFFAIRRWAIPSAVELKWDPALDNFFLHLSSGIRCDDIYLSREILRSAGPGVLRCLPAGIEYRPPETLRGMFRKYQRMRLEIERLHCYFPESKPVHKQWGRRRLDRSRILAAPVSEKLYYGLFQAALLLCRVAYRAQRFYYSRFAAAPCPTWAPVTETKERVH